MKSIALIAIVTVMLVTGALPVISQDAENRNLFKTAGAIKTDFGTLEFEGGAFPTEASVQKIYGIVRAQIRDFGFKSSSDVWVMAGFMHPSENFLTGNDVTVYAFASHDLKVDGPTVVEIPPGMYGNANDAAFKYLTDFGPTGPAKGFFVVFRFYGPLEGYIEKTWVLDDFELVK